MIPQLIQDYISKVKDKTVHIEKRQFYAATLREIIAESQSAIDLYEKEKNK